MRRARRSELLRAGAAALAFLALTFGCAANRPPRPIQEAIATVNRHLPAYVAEANKALEEAEHPDRERLAGVGVRLVEVLDALGQWAGEPVPEEGEPVRSEKRGAQETE